MKAIRVVVLVIVLLLFGCAPPVLLVRQDQGAGSPL
jgi:hypothetical protein